MRLLRCRVALRCVARVAALTVCVNAAVTGYIKLALNAGKANPSPPVGPALGSKVSDCYLPCSRSVPAHDLASLRGPGALQMVFHPGRT